MVDVSVPLSVPLAFNLVTFSTTELVVFWPLLHVTVELKGLFGFPAAVSAISVSQLDFSLDFVVPLVVPPVMPPPEHLVNLPEAVWVWIFAGPPGAANPGL